MGIYFTQMGEYSRLVLNAPSVYQFIPYGIELDENLASKLGILAAGVLVLILLALGFGAVLAYVAASPEFAPPSQLIGEGEDVLPELITLFRKAKQEGWDKVRPPAPSTIWGGGGARGSHKQRRRGRRDGNRDSVCGKPGGSSKEGLYDRSRGSRERRTVGI